ncbi:MAG: hypothetical protein KKF78_06030 [Candidatus Omnitrophica bacterium]|nr:hypothetical protein [Candidatus Omnitrophota bacterium]MBU1996695.1 hypothetical protein [Candidatus Omnitrophota bacterium]
MKYLEFINFLQEILELDHENLFSVRFILDNRSELLTQNFNIFEDRNLISGAEQSNPNNIFFIDPITIHHVKLEGPTATLGFDFNKEFGAKMSND